MSIIIILTAFIISVTSQNCSYSNNDNNINEYVENRKHEWTVVVKDVSEKTHLHISYGFVLTPQMILTVAIAISGRNANDLLVRADCFNSMSNCKYRRVVKIFLRGSEDSNLYFKNDYAILILKKPFFYAFNNNAFDVVKITGNYSEIDKTKCSVVRWKYEFCPLRFNKISYRVSICEKNFISFQTYEAQKLVNDRDRIIFSPKFDNKFAVSVSFFGSPIVCESVNNRHQKFLFGISVFDTLARIPLEDVNNPIVDLVGSYFNIVDNYYELQVKIDYAKTYITNYNSQSQKNVSISNTTFNLV